MKKLSFSPKGPIELKISDSILSKQELSRYKLSECLFYLNKVKRYQIWNQIDIFIRKKLWNEKVFIQISNITSCFSYLFLLLLHWAPVFDCCCHMTHYQWILAGSILTVTVAFCKKLRRKTHHIRQFEKVYGMRTIITILNADVTLPLYPSFFVHFKHTFVTHPTKISRFSITVTPPPRDTACTPPPRKFWTCTRFRRIKKTFDHRQIE